MNIIGIRSNIIGFIMIILTFSVLLNCYFAEGDCYSEKSDFIMPDRIFKNIKSKPYNWQEYDSHIDKKAVFRKIRPFPESFCYQSNNANDNFLLQYFHILNADKEGNADIILYDGFCKPYPRVEIWLYRDRKSDKIYSQAGYMAELGKHDELHEIVIKKDGCCCDSESVIEYVTLNNMTNSVVVKERVVYTADILIPDFTFLKKIRVASDKGILRNNPEKDDTLRTWECNDDFLVKGNILAEYPINTEGVALAKTENRKIIWFFVVIYADSDTYPYHGKIKYPISKHSVSFGWMNSDSLKIKN